MDKPNLTPQRFDKVFAAPMPKAPKVLCGAQAIGARIGVSEDFVRDRLSRLEGSPVKKIGGRYFVVEDDLIAFIRK